MLYYSHCLLFVDIRTDYDCYRLEISRRECVSSFPVFRGNLLFIPSTLHMGVVSLDEIVVNFYKTTRPHVSETDIFIVIAVGAFKYRTEFMITQCISY